MALKRSERLLARANASIPGGAQTISKRPDRFLPDGWPGFFDRASGARVWDVDGNSYVDFVLALGPVILGYAHPDVDAAVREQMERGVLTSLQSPLEVELAEKLITLVPSAEMVRYFKTGAEATSCAVRLARAVTGRETVLSSGYAGWHDWWVAKLERSESSAGVPECLREKTVDVAWGDADQVKRLAMEHAGDLAAIVIEPIATPEAGAFLQTARDMADKTGAVLVFDEIVTGFRLDIGGAQACFNVTPDLTTLGKAFANGYPLAACVGKAAIMEEAAKLWVTSTFAGDALALAAANATIDCLTTTDALQRIDHLGARLSSGLREVCSGADGVSLGGLNPMPLIQLETPSGHLDEQADEAFVRHMLDNGVLWRRNHAAFICASHSEADIDHVLEIADTFFSGRKDAGTARDADGRVAAL